jgi:hypothetical protein
MKNFNIELNLANNTVVSQDDIYVVGGDTNSYQFTVSLKDGTDDYDLTAIDHAWIIFSKKDGNVVQGNMTIDTLNSILIYELGTNEIACSGNVNVEIQLYNADSTVKLTSGIFRFLVRGALASDEMAESTTEFGAITELISDVESAEATRQNNEATRQTSFNAMSATIESKADKSTTYTKTEVDTISSNKVDKVTNKGLSTNDYTTSDKDFLFSIKWTAFSDAIQQGTNHLFMTLAERTKLEGVTGSNTGDETTTTIKTKLGFTPENSANKTTNLLTPDNTKYPTVLAVTNGIDTAINSLKDGVSDDGNTLAKLKGLISGVKTLLNSNDVNLDTLQEIVTYIKNNKSVLDGVTTNKVNVSDIINDLVHVDTNKPLSANMGRLLKDLIDSLTNNKANQSTTYTKTEVDNAFIEESQKGANNGVVSITSDGYLGQQKLSNYTERLESAYSTYGGISSFDLTYSRIFKAIINSPITIGNFTNIPSSGVVSVTLFLTMGTTAYSVGFNSVFKWTYGATPLLGANKTHELVFKSLDGGATWYASKVGEY